MQLLVKKKIWLFKNVWKKWILFLFIWIADYNWISFTLSIPFCFSVQFHLKSVDKRSIFIDSKFCFSKFITSVFIIIDQKCIGMGAIGISIFKFLWLSELKVFLKNVFIKAKMDVESILPLLWFLMLLTNLLILA